MHRQIQILSLILGLAGIASGQISEHPDAKDHPVVSRYSGSVLLDAAESNYVELEIPAPQTQKEPLIAKGKLAWRLYLAPEGRTSLEVARNYEAALAKAGFKPVVTCFPGNCRLINYRSPAAFVEGAGKSAPGSRIRLSYGGRDPINPSALFSGANDQSRAAIVAVRAKGNANTYVFVLAASSKAPGNATMEATKLESLGLRTYTFVEVVEEAAVETGKVDVSDAASIASGLNEEGRKALYGIYFDTGKSDLKPESQTQLEQIAMLLLQDPKLNLYIVGHTDSVGSLESNIALSRSRAQAVVAALTTQYKVSAVRLNAQGLGPLAPIASNATEEGKALNRRVELVLR